MKDSSVQIIGLGACTPIGRNVWASAAAARAGICGFHEHPFMIDTAGEPMCVARAPWLDVDVEGVDRYFALLMPAIEESMQLIAKVSRAPRIGLALALPPNRPGHPQGLVEALWRRIRQEESTAVLTPLGTFEVGHAAGHQALEAAVASCQAAAMDAVVVAGVDSYLAPETLEWLEQCDQLHFGGPMNNAWGFIPGEAAGSVLVARHDFAQRHRLAPIGELVSVGLGQEPKLIKTDAVCIGEGLTQAFRTALESLPLHEQIHNIFCDLNGETYRADEYGFTALRTKERFRAATDFIAPADCWGDVGAASGPLHTSLAVISHRKHYGKGPLSMAWASSECGVRGATVVRALDRRGH